ncbi:MAG: hypothetical protein J7J68_01945, partial [Thermotogaceae bacterium]|nr:hypothetical protein [Thermotogaceae bacterium]
LLRKRSRKGIWITVAVIAVLGGVALWYWFGYQSIVNSSEFKSETVHIAFVEKERGIVHFLRIDTAKRMIYSVKLPEFAFDSELNRGMNIENPMDVLSFVEEMLGLSSGYRAYAVVTDQQLAELSEKVLGSAEQDFENFLSSLARRDAKLTDYFTFKKWVNILKPESNMTPSYLAKLIIEARRSAIRFYEPKTITEKPIKITVQGRTYERIYLDEDSVNSVKNDVNR